MKRAQCWCILNWCLRETSIAGCAFSLCGKVTCIYNYYRDTSLVNNDKLHKKTKTISPYWKKHVTKVVFYCLYLTFINLIHGLKYQGLFCLKYFIKIIISAHLYVIMGNLIWSVFKIKRDKPDIIFFASLEKPENDNKINKM